MATPPTIRSIRALAKLVKRSHVTVGKWVKRDDWPWHPRGPWPVTLLPKIREWAELLQEDRAEGSHGDWTDADRAALERECPDLLTPDEMRRVADFLGVPLKTRAEVDAEVARLHALADAADPRPTRRRRGRIERRATGAPSVTSQ